MPSASSENDRAAAEPHPLAGPRDHALRVAKLVGRARRKAERRAEAVAGDLAAIDEAQAWAARAPWLITAAARAKRGEKILRVSDYSSGEEQVLELPLDPTRSAREQVETIFTEARRLRRGRDRVVVRLAQVQEEAAELSAMEQELLTLANETNEDAASDLALRLEAIESRLATSAPKVAREARGEREGERLPYRTFVVRGDLKVFVGRDAKSNDELTLHVARPHHVWLHAKGAAGSHVVACVAKGHTLSAEQLVDCALLAAHFSEARGELVVDVSYLPRRYVRKPRKSAPGAVVLDREKVLVLRVDGVRLAELLAGPARSPSGGSGGQSDAGT